MARETAKVGKASKCRGCGGEIVFLKTAAGRVMPADAETVEPGDEQFDHARHVSHFATCSKADQFRRPR